MNDTNNDKYGRQQNLPGDKSHNQTESNPDWGDDKRKINPSNEADRAENRKESQEKSEKHTVESEGASGESKHPDHKKDTQSNQSDDPTRKNEANQGTSDLRKRERTNFKREGEDQRRKE